MVQITRVNDKIQDSKTRVENRGISNAFLYLNLHELPRLLHSSETKYSMYSHIYHSRQYPYIFVCIFNADINQDNTHTVRIYHHCLFSIHKIYTVLSVSVFCCLDSIFCFLCLLSHTTHTCIHAHALTQNTIYI